jgi:subtilisin family serine protease
MRNCTLIILCVIGSWIGCARGGDVPAAGPRAVAFRQDRILVKPKANADLSGVHAGLKCTSLWKSAAMSNLQVVKLPAGANVSDMIARYMGSGLVAYAEPDYAVFTTAIPNDPQYGNGTQWWLHNTGAGGGIAGADIHASEAWDIRTSAPGIIVAMVDSGMRYTHEDLAANVWTNPGEIPANGIDDDGNGITDDVHGVNTVDDSADVRDDAGHGTHTAGVIGGLGNNGVGGSGVAWSVQLMPCKALDASGNGSISTVVKAIDYARAHGARVINNSYGINAPLEAPLAALNDAVAVCRAAGIMFVVSAGNEAIDNDQMAAAPSYPASFAFDNIVSVAATNRADGLSFFSNYGQASVDLGAPGEEIVSAAFTSDTSYGAVSGTSESAPIVSGALALLAAQFPGETYLQLYNRLFAGVDPLPGLQGRCRSGGRLNLFKALASASSRPANDDFAAAITIAGAPFTVSGINVDATKEAGEPNHGGDPGGRSVWWSWTAPASGRVLLTTAGSSFSAVLGVYTGTAVGQLTAVASGSPGTAAFDTAAGTQYFIAVDGAGGASGSITLALKYPPLNDDFAAASVISDLSVQNGSNVNATREAGEPLHATNFGGKSVWWQWTPATPVRIAITTEDSTFDTVLAVYTGSALTALTEVASNDDEDALYGLATSRVEFDAAAGTQYWIVVDGYDGGSGQIRLHLQPTATTVRVFATVPWAAETGPRNGEFTVTRTGATAGELVVRYRMLSEADSFFSFTPIALNGIDFQQLPGTVTIPAGAASATIAVVPTDNTTYDGSRDATLELLSSPDYDLRTHYSDTVHISDNDVFVVESALTATPNPAYARSPVTFTLKTNGRNVVYSWDFGDGTADSSSDGKIKHVFPIAGNYTVTVAVFFTDAGLGPTPVLTERLTIPVQAALAMEVSSLQVKLNLVGRGDRISVKGRVQLPPEFTAAGTAASVHVGGLPIADDSAFFFFGDETADNGRDEDAVSASFVLNKGGVSSIGYASLRLSRPDDNGNAGFTFMMNRVWLQDALDDEGLTNTTVQNAPVTVPFTVNLGTMSYYVNVPALYSAKAGKKGIAKGPVP